jgi:hypothetical protein
VVRFDATTLWHFDAAERAPSATSFATDPDGPQRPPTSAVLQNQTSDGVLPDGSDGP